MASSAVHQFDRSGRRSRYKRHSTGKRLRLNDRDQAIFELLWRYRFLRSDRIVERLAPNSSKRLVERLGDLYHETFHLDRPTQQWDRARSDYEPIVYALTRRGLDAYGDGLSSLRFPEPLVRFGGASTQHILQFHHAQQISDVVFDVEQMVRSDPSKRFVPEGDILKKASDKLGKPIAHTILDVSIPPSHYVTHQNGIHRDKVIPDALFGIEHQSSTQSAYRFYALEVERGNHLIRRSLQKASTLKKLLAYRALLQTNAARTQLSLPNLFMIIATTNEDLCLKAIELAQDVWSDDDRRFLLFAPPETLRTKRPNDPALSSSPLRAVIQEWRQHFEA